MFEHHIFVCHDVNMRTTLTLDDDLAGILQRKAGELGVSFKEVVNRTLREGLEDSREPTQPQTVRTRPHDFGFKPGVDLDRLNQLADELEAETFRDRQASGKA